MSSRWRYLVNALAYALARRVATPGSGSATENVSRSSVGFALTLEFASSAAAVRSGSLGALTALSATAPTRASLACVAA